MSDIVERLITGGESQEELLYLCTKVAPKEIETLRQRLADAERERDGWRDAYEKPNGFKERLYELATANATIEQQRARIERLRKALMDCEKVELFSFLLDNHIKRALLRDTDQN